MELYKLEVQDETHALPLSEQSAHGYCGVIWNVSNVFYLIFDLDNGQQCLLR
jgi:hypothetical protein